MMSRGASLRRCSHHHGQKQGFFVAHLNSTLFSNDLLPRECARHTSSPIDYYERISEQLAANTDEPLYRTHVGTSRTNRIENREKEREAIAPKKVQSFDHEPDRQISSVETNDKI
jgi:hypothetical protein